ncbi:cell envelope biogenesis protein OmpA [Vreelandella aquamarina]|jgi:outer membrane protein OmpA-like peptidoglycan-associated protein|uniref:Cell envelope biogenesis protein OmpA n=1 Tax=Vreelandella aquamarina TaxID=77097 RepID=A0A1N6D2L4_9GAMM|nr:MULTISPECIES: OmpA family protein [Halomonas]SIN64946.1 Outer membrane protein OmpA [Halomonas meridiana]SIN75678.1 Outer membrane protein OmpA [Halomonas meridiana]SIO38236.1 Outer membrane protein OmpA [Halomonas meridiana]BCB72079.1 cell envelope biogenesis protein OmpA [Halomonas meridiana]GED47034.1 cell envelope biogenesis protein OmpA [Halomonas meridiana]|tara:strand:+ start:290 stop:961 length:672 start_codon:yes stop_codon:yes gene_type:complete
MRISRLLTPLAAAILLAGCATSDPYGGQTQRSSTAMGTGIGAAIGAAAGALSGDGSTSRRDRALIGAAVGAAAGAGMGAYMDRQEQQLRDNLQGSRIEIDRRGDDIVLNMPSSVTFGFDSAELTADARSALNEVANVLTQYTDTRVNIAGHTDSTGDASYNQRLSERRAQSVGNYLSQNGVSSMRLNTMGYGANQPVASNATEQGRAQNRRVEITLTPTGNGQ